MPSAIAVALLLLTVLSTGLAVLSTRMAAKFAREAHDIAVTLRAERIAAHAAVEQVEQLDRRIRKLAGTVYETRRKTPVIEHELPEDAAPPVAAAVPTTDFEAWLDLQNRSRPS